MKHFSGLSFLLLFLQFATAQTSDTIYWNPERKLKWEDFKGKPDKTTKLLAMTQAGISYEVGCNDDNLEVRIFCYFNTNQSWTKEKSGEEYLLEHEQLHFDITELYTRKLRQKISEVPDPCGKNFSELSKIYQNNFKECAAEQDRYDFECNHSLEETKQKEWELKVAKELKELQNFAAKL